MFRKYSCILLIVILSWYAMMVVHEMGHCLGAWVSGGTVDAVSIPLLGFSRTDFSGGNPLLIVWAGPVGGVVLPVILMFSLLRLNARVNRISRFFAGFCLLINGIYIGGGSFESVGDCGMLLKYGSLMWSLLLFGTVSAGYGLYIWHKSGPVKEWLL